MKISNNAIFLILAIILVGSSFFLISNNFSLKLSAATLYSRDGSATSTLVVPIVPQIPKHLSTPEPLHAIYMSSWVAGSKSIRERLIKLMDSTEINAVVIDVKDSTGAVSFKMDDPLLKKIDPFQDRISDIGNLINILHKKNIYVIARVAVFEDPHLAKMRPDLAVKRASDGGTWKDRKGLSWSDMGSKDVWDYNIAVAKGAYDAGFDEINFDYIRFPSDGNMEDIMYSSFAGKKIDKSIELRNFYSYLSQNMKPVGVPISADLFGMTTTNTDDLNIGQVLENAIPYFDYIDPMVYPSHYPNDFHGYKNPAEHPYDMIKYVMSSGVDRMIAASSTPDKLRPWLQDFNLGAVYTAPMVRDEINATYDVGLRSWLLWDASNHYTPAALDPKSTTTATTTRN